MSYTSPELVRRHLNTVRIGELPVAGVPVVLTGTQSVQLPHRALVEGSVVVKASRSDTFIRETLVMTDDWLSLTHTDIIAQSTLVASESSLGTVYVENVDYVVDLIGGRIRRLTTGTIASGGSVVLFYKSFHRYVEGDDYAVNPSTGSLNRLAGGLIADGQTVLADYRVAPGDILDATIEHAIAEASDQVGAIVDTRYQNQLVPGVVVGETHFAVAAICRIQAVSALSGDESPSSPSRETARLWLELSNTYDNSGRERLARFAPPTPALQSARRG